MTLLEFIERNPVWSILALWSLSMTARFGFAALAEAFRSWRAR